MSYIYITADHAAKYDTCLCGMAMKNETIFPLFLVDSRDYELKAHIHTRSLTNACILLWSTSFTTTCVQMVVVENDANCVGGWILCNIQLIMEITDNVPLIVYIRDNQLLFLYNLRPFSTTVMKLCGLNLDRRNTLNIRHTQHGSSARCVWKSLSRKWREL